MHLCDHAGSGTCGRAIVRRNQLGQIRSILKNIPGMNRAPSGMLVMALSYVLDRIERWRCTEIK